MDFKVKMWAGAAAAISGETDYLSLFDTLTAGDYQP